MKNDKIHLLVTFDKNYIKPFQTMLKSLVVNNPKENIHVWLLHSAIPKEDLQNLEEYCKTQNVTLEALQVERSIFQNAPITKRYPQEMYYRLLASYILPTSLEKVLYIDPDILVINPIRPLWEMPLGENTFAAASHTDVFGMIDNINKIRIGKEHKYFNSGVMLIDLNKARQLVKPEEIFACVREHSDELLLPDQDVFNYLYGEKTLPIDDIIWNYDARYFSEYQLRSGGASNMDWVIQNTVFLHFCGKKKPWKATYLGKFSALYKHYMKFALQEEEK